MEPISKANITKMKLEYENTFRKASTANLKKKFPERPWIEEVTSTWVSRKELEALLNDNNADDLGIYYGCHYESTNKNLHKDYLGLHNIILVATKETVDPQNPTTENSKDQLNDDETKPTVVNGTTQQNYAGSGGDLLTLCHPRCPK